MSSPVRLALLAHGSRDPAWGEAFAPLMAALARACGPDAARLCFLEGVGPNLAEVAAEAAADGIGELRVLPLFWNAKGHVMRDVPSQLERAAEAAAVVARARGASPPALRLLAAVGEQAGIHAAIVALGVSGLAAGSEHAVSDMDAGRQP